MNCSCRSRALTVHPIGYSSPKDWLGQGQDEAEEEEEEEEVEAEDEEKMEEGMRSRRKRRRSCRRRVGHGQRLEPGWQRALLG